MTQLYFVETPSRDQRMVLCRWVEQFYEQGHLVQIVVDATLAAQHVDQLLWTFAQESFIPHSILKGPGGRATNDDPVLITVGEVLREERHALVCDAPVGLEFMQRYAMALHFVLQDDTERRQESRLLWQAAKDAGFQVIHVPYDLRSRAARQSASPSGPTPAS